MSTHAMVHFKGKTMPSVYEQGDTAVASLTSADWTDIVTLFFESAQQRDELFTSVAPLPMALLHKIVDEYRVLRPGADDAVLGAIRRALGMERDEFGVAWYGELVSK